MTRSERARHAAAVLNRLYPDPAIPLRHENPFTLCVAVLLSAHTTDRAVNKATPELFRQAPTPEAMLALGPKKIEALIRTVGLAPTKSKNLWNLARLLLERHGGKVPDTLESLEALPGVGHKTASVVMAQAFGKPAFPVDTHIHRLAQRWGLSNGRSVVQTEKDLKGLYPERQWAKLHLQIIYYGREYCPARGHDLNHCALCREFGGGLRSRSAKTVQRK
jgi:endonuclease-3